MRLLIALLVMAMSPQAQPQTQDGIDADLAKTISDSQEIVDTLARCKGYWTWMSEVAVQLGRPSAAAYLKTYANGAQTAALWILSAQYQVEHPGASARTLGSFSDLIAGPAEVERLRMAALYEANDSPALDAAGELCRQTASAIDPLLQSIKKDIFSPSPTDVETPEGAAKE